MALTIIERPSTLTAFLAAKNPIVFKFSRKDYLFTSTTYYSDFQTTILFTGVDYTSNFLIGDDVALTLSDGTARTGVVSYSNFSAGNTTIRVSGAFGGSGAGHINNVTEFNSFRIEVQLWDETFTNQLSFAVLTGTPKTNGEAVVDVAGFIQDVLLNEENNNSFGANVYDDSDTYVRFKIKYKYIYRDRSGTQTSGSTTSDSQEYIAVNGALQVPANNANDLVDYVMLNNDQGVLHDETNFTVGWSNVGVGETWTFGASNMTVSIDVADSKKAQRNATLTFGKRYSLRIQFNVSAYDTPFRIKAFLGGTQEIDFGYFSAEDGSTIDETVYFYPSASYTYYQLFATTLITGGDVVDLTITRVIVEQVTAYKFLNSVARPVYWRDYPFALSLIVGSSVPANSFLRVLVYSGTTLKHTLNIVYDTVKKVVQFNLNAIMNHLLLEDSTEMKVTYYKGGTSTPLSETLTLDIKEPCSSVMYLMARNSLGGVLQWAFDYSQDVQMIARGTRKRNRYSVFSRVNQNEFAALQDFMSDNEVFEQVVTNLTSSTYKTSGIIGQQCYKVNSDGSKIGVIVLPSKNVMTTRSQVVPISFDVELPNQF